MRIDIPAGKKKIVGIGAALVDILARETDAFLKGISEIKGGMTLVDNPFIENVSKKMTGEVITVSGGAACNTIVGIGKLGGDARFIGKTGRDSFGILFESDLKKNHVEPFLFQSSSPNGKVLSIITPDAQRSMFTFLGAASELAASDISEACFKDAAIVLVEAYLLYNSPELVIKAMKMARNEGALVAMDLSSFTVVNDFKSLLQNEVNTYVNILIANEDEAYAFTGHRDEKKAIAALSEGVDVAVLKVGKRGSYINHDGKVTAVEPLGSGDAIDTTGAGDLWASGFLFGIVNGWTLSMCGKIASACGYEVCQVIGAKIPDTGWGRIQKMIEDK
ncbi:MAG: adenosine kinase [Proteobacteria bacterium]|nr:adenosine kinase [Pseudomonadota bacterium]